MNKSETILITGSCGMIGKSLRDKMLNRGYSVIGVDCRVEKSTDNYRHLTVNLENSEKLAEIFDTYKIDRVIHLAALAHAFDGRKLGYGDYYAANVVSASNIFNASARKKIPVLFISTVDVFGFTGTLPVNADTPVSPVTSYGKTKALAEDSLKKICFENRSKYTIFRFSPVYTDTVKRDIQKRYYLKYPNWAYQIGGGNEYEVLNIKKAVYSMCCWVREEPQNNIKIIKDEKLLNTREMIAEEKDHGRALHVLKFPKWAVDAGFFVLKAIMGENKYTFLLNKAVNPLRTE